MSHAHGHASSPPLAGRLAPPAEVRSGRLIVTLALAGALAGLMIVTVFQWAQPRILAHQAEVLRLAVIEVLAGPERTERYFVLDGRLAAEPPAGADTLRIQRVFLGFDAADAPIGFAVTGAAPGFMDLVHVIFGYDPRTRRVLGMKVLDNKETPGLGDAIEKDVGFVRGFAGVLAPLVGVKPGAFRGADHEIAMITGATISARTVITVINTRIEEVGPILEAHLTGGGR
jgi:Na+-translocating ferredoxin:NAD+ oxidoreductase subunit G